MKRAIYPLFAAADESKARPILNALKARGVTVRDGKTDPGKEDALLLFLSGALQENDPAAEQFFRFNEGRALIIPVNLDGTTPPESLQNALMARHTLDGAKYGTEELADRIARAAKGDGKSKLPLILSVAAAVILLAVGGIIYWKNRPQTQVEQTVEATATPTPEPTAVPTPEPTATPRLPDNSNLAFEELEKVHELIIVGDTLTYFTGDEGWIAAAGLARVSAEYVANRSFEDGQPRWYSTEDGHEFSLYDWGDMEFLTYMKNLMLLTLVDVQGTLPDLSHLEKLSLVELLDCDIDDISAVKDCRLMAFNYSGPGIDLSPLNGIDTLSSMTLQFYGADELDLSSFGPAGLRDLTLNAPINTGRVDLSGLNNCNKLERVRLDDLPLTDLACLSSATRLDELELDGLERLTSLNGLDFHENLTRIWIDNCFSLSNIDALTGCTALSEVELYDCRISDLAGLSGAQSLRKLQLGNMGTLRSLHGLENHGNLKNVEMQDLQSLTDISALESCTALMSLKMWGCYDMHDVSPVVQLPKLRDLQLYGSGPGNVDFLWDIRDKEYFSFGISEVGDWSGLAAIEKYSYLNITDRNGSALPYVENATVTDLELWNRGGWNNQSEGMDMTRLPKVTNELLLHCVTSLEGLDQPKVRRLILNDCPYLTSLSGAENLNNLVLVEVCNCPRLTDWSALDGKALAEISLEALFTLPDFGKISVRDISLTTIYDLKDLSCFADYDPKTPYKLSLMDVDGVTDLSPLYRLRGEMLRIPAHLQEQAQALKDSGLLVDYEVTYPEGWWEPVEPHIELLSLEEIDTLPSALLSRITSLTLAGDTIVQDEWAWVEEDYSTYPPNLYIRYDGVDDLAPVEPGTLTDLTCLSKLTGLEGLTVYAQPELTSLEGIENMGELKRLNIYQAAALTDASAAFTVQSLEDLSLRFTAVSSIQGVQNLYALKRLHVNDSPVADLSPLTACPALEDVNFHLPMMTFEELKAQPELVLRSIQSLTIAGEYVYDGGPWWFETDWVTDPPKLYLHSNETDERLPVFDGPVTDMGELAALLPNLENLGLYAQPLTTLDGVESFSQLWRISMEECRRITDFSPLWNVATLGEVSLCNEPIDSIEGIEKLPHLVSLSLSGCRVKDFSPLTRVDYSYCTSGDYFGWAFSLALDVATNQELTYEDYAPLEAVPIYWSLNMNNVNVDKWLGHVMDKEMYELSCHRSGITNEQLKAFVEAHPMLEQLDLRWNTQLTDLSCLLELKELRKVQVSEDMPKAIASLGEGYGFELNIE